MSVTESSLLLKKRKACDEIVQDGAFYIGLFFVHVSILVFVFVVRLLMLAVFRPKKRHNTRKILTRKDTNMRQNVTPMSLL